MDTDDRLAHSDRTLGVQANSFFESDLGKFIINKSKEEVEENKDLLTAVEPEDTTAIRTLQQNIAVARIGLVWIDEALNIGIQRFQQDEVDDTN